MNKLKVLCIHHTDLDGAGSAACVGLKHINDDVTYRIYNYGWPLEEKEFYVKNIHAGYWRSIMNIALANKDYTLLKEAYIELQKNEVPNINDKINYNFINVPSIIGTVNDDIEAYVVVQSSTKTNKKAVIQAFKNDGTATGAKVNLRLKGY